mgnify:CR=1 FL=1
MSLHKKYTRTSGHNDLTKGVVNRFWKKPLYRLPGNILSLNSELFEATPTPTATPTLTPTPTTPNPLILKYDFSNTYSYPGTGVSVIDLTGHCSGSLHNGVSFGNGECGNNYIYFDGTNDYLTTDVDLNSFLQSPSSNLISLFMWIYPIENGVVVSEQGSTTPDSDWYDAQIELVSGVFNFGVWPYNFGTPKIISSISTPLNQWHYIGFTYDGTTLKAYVNGQLAGSSVYSRVSPGSSGKQLHYILGYGSQTNMSSSANFAKMQIGTLEVYNIGLSNSDVLNNYNNSSDFWNCYNTHTPTPTLT